MPKPSSMAGRELNRSELSALFGVAPTTIDHWRNEGLPCSKKGKAVVFNSRAVFEWIQDRAKRSVLRETESLADGDVTRRTMVAEMQIKEATAAKATGDAVSIEEFRQATSDLVATVRSKVLAFAPRYSPEIAQQIVDAVNPDATSEVLEEARQVVEASLRRASNEVLDELSDGVEQEPEEELAAA